MKLLFCPECWDVFKLAYDTRACACGKVVGRYDADGHNAVSNGQGVSMALDNNFVMLAMGRMEAFQEDGTADNYEQYYENNRLPFWIRPNDGPGNPRSTVDPTLTLPHHGSSD